jgi:hypothetical protein
MLVLGFCTVSYMPLWIWESEVGILVTTSISGLLLLSMFYQTILKIFREDIKHAKAWRKWLREPKQKVTVDDIIAVLPTISSQHAHKLIRVIRQENMLEVSQQSLHFVNQLIRLIENPALENQYSQSLSPFLEDIGSNTINSNRLEAMFLDELFLLVQKMKSMSDKRLPYSSVKSM